MKPVYITILTVVDYSVSRPYLVGTLVRSCRCAASWSDLDLTFNPAVVTLTYKTWSGLYLGNRWLEPVIFVSFKFVN